MYLPIWALYNCASIYVYTDYLHIQSLSKLTVHHSLKYTHLF